MQGERVELSDSCETDPHRWPLGSHNLNIYPLYNIHIANMSRTGTCEVLIGELDGVGVWAKETYIHGILTRKEFIRRKLTKKEMEML